MTYLENLKLEAAKTVEGLAANVVELEKQIAKIEDRILFERGDVLRREEDLTHFKESAAAKLALSTSKYQEWQNRLGRLTADLATARSALVLLENEIAPRTKAAREVAREKLTQALRGLYLAGRPRCQARMAELLEAVVAEHDDYFHACQRLHADFGLAFATPAFDNGIIVEHARFAHFGKRLLTSPMHYLAFSDPPAEAAPSDAGDRQTAPGATRGERLDSQDAPDAPGATPTPALDTGAVPEQAPNAVQSVQDPEEAALDAPGAANGERPDSLDPAPDMDPEKKGTTLRTGATPGPAGMDPDAPPDLEAQDCASVDAEDQADLDAEAPPDAGEKNPGIAAELDTEAPSTPTPGETVQAADPPSA